MPKEIPKRPTRFCLARGLMLDKVEAHDYDAALGLMERVMALIPSGPE